MNKRFTFILLTLPLVASCHGGFISKEAAKERIDHLNEILTNTESEEYIKREDYTLSSFERKQSYKDDMLSKEIKEIYNLEKAFYHIYEFRIEKDVSEESGERRSVVESWDYGSHEDDKYYIYHVTRENGKVSDSGNPVYKVNRDVYKEEANYQKGWEEIVFRLKDENRAYTLNGLSDVNGIYDKIVEENGIAVSYVFNSLNDNSVYVGAHYHENDVLHEYEISIENAHLNLYKHRLSENDYNNIEINYNARVDRLEPNISNDESHPYNDTIKD